MQVFTESEIREVYDKGVPIYFDTMVIRNLWKKHSNPRASLLESMKPLSGRTYLPYQVQAELYRQAYSDSVLNNVPRTGMQEPRGMLQKVRKAVLDEVLEVHPHNLGDGVSEVQIKDFSSAVAAKFDEFTIWFDEVDQQLKDWLGDELDVNAIRRGIGSHALLDEVAEVFEPQHLLESPDKVTLVEWTAEYQARVSRDDPVGPGKSDTNKGSVEERAGDYFIWKEILSHCVGNGFSDGFMFVTEERKPDLWQVQQGEKSLRRIDPRIQLESIEATGGPMIVISFNELLELAVADDGQREILTNISESTHDEASDWDKAAYSELLAILDRQNYARQYQVIVAAAKAGGYIDRAEIGKVLGWGETNRYLTRFRMPVDRAKQELVNMDLIGVDASDPLWAVYEGPGEAVGYAVPSIFAEFQLDHDRSIEIEKSLRLD